MSFKLTDVFDVTNEKPSFLQNGFSVKITEIGTDLIDGSAMMPNKANHNMTAKDIAVMNGTLNHYQFLLTVAQTINNIMKQPKAGRKLSFTINLSWDYVKFRLANSNQLSFDEIAILEKFNPEELIGTIYDKRTEQPIGQKTWNNSNLLFDEPLRVLCEIRDIREVKKDQVVGLLSIQPLNWDFRTETSNIMLQPRNRASVFNQSECANKLQVILDVLSILSRHTLLVPVALELKQDCQNECKAETKIDNKANTLQDEAREFLLGIAQGLTHIANGKPEKAEKLMKDFHEKAMKNYKENFTKINQQSKSLDELIDMLEESLKNIKK